MVRRKKPRSAVWWNVIGHARNLLRDPDGRIQLGIYVALCLLIFSVPGIIDRALFSPLQITPAEARFGWDEATARQEAPAIAASMPKFAIRDSDGNVVSGAGKNAELWKFAKLINDGKHIATWKQQSGDCVSMGWSNAIAYRMAFQIAKEQRNEILKIPFPPYAYGTSRVLVGGRQLGRGQGSIGAWAAQASLSWGVLPTDKANELGYVYSGQLADRWGWEGPPKVTTDYASKFRIRTVSQVRSWEDVRDALVHGFPVTVASNVGFDGGYYDRDGKRWLQAGGKWPHQMCFIGVEDRPGRLKGAYCINSWGINAHPRPLHDEPPGGFWVDWQWVQRMVAQGDSWAYSDFDGFPSEDAAGADWNAFKLTAVNDEAEAELVARAEQPEPQPALLEVRQMVPLEILIPIALFAVLLMAGCLYARYGMKSKIAGTLLLVACIFGVAERAEAGYRHRLAQMQRRFAASQCATCPTGVCATGNCPTANCANGQCSTGYQRPANKPRNPYAGLSSDAIPDAVQVATAETIPEALFNPFASPTAQDAAPNVWTAFAPPGPKLRTYADCYAHETDFLLIVGNEADALHELETAAQPVAFEKSHPSIKVGKYHMFQHQGKLLYKSHTPPLARVVGAISVRKQQ